VNRKVCVRTDTNVTDGGSSDDVCEDPPPMNSECFEGNRAARQRVVGLFEGVDWSWKVVDGMRGLSGQRLEGEAARGDAKTRGNGRS
jgi:hypothetical protein